MSQEGAAPAGIVGGHWYVVPMKAQQGNAPCF